MTYVSEVQTNKKYTSNVVVQIGSDYFAIRQPDSGLSIASPYDKCLTSLVLNPTSIDILKVNTTIASATFRLLDKNGVISALVLGDAAGLIGQAVTVYLGRSGTGMAFSGYYAMPVTYIQKCEHSDESYSFTCAEQTERMAKPIYDFKTALGVDILSGTTIWTMRDDISTFPTAGFLKVENEFVSYTGVDLVNNRFTGVIRGELNSVAVAHAANSDTVLVETITDNPLNIILKLLISGGGGGTYDTLQDGLGIDNTLIDIAGIEALRDELFLTNQFTLSLYSIDSALKYIEEQLLAPNNLRLTNSRDSKVTLAILNKARFVEEDDVIDEDSITKYPKWTLDGAKVTNVIEVNWDFDEPTNVYQKRSTYRDDDSIAVYGVQPTLSYSFNGIKASLDGQALADDFGTTFLARISMPTPEISINTQLDKSLQTIGDKSYLISSKIPAADGTLNFASDLEIVSRSINHTNGDVAFKLAFTSFTNMRSGFIAPSDLITAKTSQSVLGVVAGRGTYYSAGWVMRLWDQTNQVYFADAPNTILSVVGDTITFANNWTTVFDTSGRYRLRFADYDDVAETQKRYCFISNGGADFSDGKQTYKVTY